MPATTPAALFDLLLTLLQAEAMPPDEVLRRLKPLATATRQVPERLGRSYLIVKGPLYQLTAVFEKPTFSLYQVTLRLDPAAFTQVKQHAHALPARAPATAEWSTGWFGLWPRLLVRHPGPPERQVTARFTSLLPSHKVVVLTRG
ncbi:hypothetical protein [Hymenobacter sublimis]|uniref:Uncharacterized protein n=1 Tax=Hymenobacter sublimis TaxID=2933777 RepID=A0ABY4JFP0_9BACT|nr:hypothetical protein [Hymenobacter sublimis]UPL51286.1 hypothetical protein MWH26_19330 [Hymenobacter sublimis]